MASVTTTFTNGTTADATEVNQNFTDLVNEFNATTGHDHDGSDSKKVPEANVTFDTSAGHEHTGTDSKKPTLTKLGQFTRDISTAGGTQAVTGIGFTPTMVIFLASQDTTSKTSIGIDDGSGTIYGVYNSHGATADTWSSMNTDSIVALESGSADYKGEISSLDSDGFTVTWTKNGSPTGTLNVAYLAIRW